MSLEDSMRSNARVEPQEVFIRARMVLSRSDYWLRPQNRSPDRRRSLLFPPDAASPHNSRHPLRRRSLGACRRVQRPPGTSSAALVYFFTTGATRFQRSSKVVPPISPTLRHTSASMLHVNDTLIPRSVPNGAPKPWVIDSV